MAIYAVTAVDAVVFNDTASGFQTSSHNASDSFGVSTSGDKPDIISFWFHIEDNMSFMDSPERLEVVRDGIVVADAAYVTSTQAVYVSDGIKFRTEPKTVFQVYVYDTVDFVADSKNVITGYASDTLRILDAGYRYTTYVVEVSDEAIFGDDSDNRVDFSPILQDGVLFVDEPFPVIRVTASDSVADFGDHTTWHLKHPANDEAVFSDNATAEVRWALYAEDTVEFSEAHKFSLWATASEIIRVLDWTDDVRIRKDAFDNVNFTDRSDMFRRYKVQCSEDLILSDHIDGDITPYIKWLADDLIVTDDSTVTAHFKPIIRNHVGFTDDATARKIVHVTQEEGINIADSADSAVYFATPLEGDSELIMTDTATIKVSRYVTTEFTNALYAGVGGTELTVYTCPVDADVTHILNISLANVLAGDITVQVTLYKDGVTPYNIRKDLPIAEGETFVINNIEESGIVIESGDEIRVQSTSPASLDVFISVIEKTQ